MNTLIIARRTWVKGSRSSGKTTFLTKLGLFVISVGDFVITSESALKMISPANNKSAWSEADSKGPNEVLNNTPNVIM
jgi:hypothetical protein